MIKKKIKSITNITETTDGVAILKQNAPVSKEKEISVATLGTGTTVSGAKECNTGDGVTKVCLTTPSSTNVTANPVLGSAAKKPRVKLEKKIMVKHDSITLNVKSDQYIDPDKVDLPMFVELVRRLNLTTLCCWNCTEAIQLTAPVVEASHSLILDFASQRTTRDSMVSPVAPLTTAITAPAVSPPCAPSTSLLRAPPVYICDFINDDLQNHSLSGHFCSLGCCFCFLDSRPDYNTPILMSNTMVFYRKFLNEWFKNEPDRSNKIQVLLTQDKAKSSPYLTLKKFGVGTLSIPEYRNLVQK